MLHDSSESGERAPVRYQVPTHLNVPDQLTLPLLGVTVQVTMRQGLLLLIGGSLAFHLWQQLTEITTVSSTGAAVRLILVGGLVLLTLVWTICSVAGRTLEDWLLVLLRYHRLPRIYVWQRLPTFIERTEPSRPLTMHVPFQAWKEDEEDQSAGWNIWERQAA